MGSLPLLPILVLVWSTSALDVRYVKPNSPSSLSCPGQPCLTLDQYAEKSNVYFTTGAAFVFLTGNHTLTTAVKLRGISNITLRGSNDSVINVILKNGANLVCKNVTGLEVVGQLTFVLTNQTGLSVTDSKILLSKLTFFGSGEVSVITKAIDCHHSDIVLVSCTFERNIGSYSGAILATGGSNITLINSIFNANTATYGGVLHTRDSSVTLIRNTCRTNRAQSGAGGVIYAQRSNITLSGNTFSANGARLGGAVYVWDSNLTLLNGNIFSKNTAADYGGGIYALDSTIAVKKGTTGNSFTHNFASYGGALYFDNCTFDSRSKKIRTLSDYDDTSTLQYTLYLLNNTADYNGGGVALVHGSNAILYNVNLTSNSGNALYSDHSNITITGGTCFSKNTGDMGGAIYSYMSFILLSGYTLFERNTADYGGAIGVLGGEIILRGNTSFQLNTASEGGALYASGTDITFSSAVSFASNSASFGGAMYFNSASTLTFKTHTNLTTSRNHASQQGGAIFHDDSPTKPQCDYIANLTPMQFLPLCFMRLEVANTTTNFSMNSHEDSAGRTGSYMYGGLLDKCLLDSKDGVYRNPYSLLTKQISNKSEVTSQPYHLLFCKTNRRIENFRVYRGHEFVISLSALAQGNIATSTLITAKVDSTASLKLHQSMQYISQSCSTLSYNLYSIKDQEELILYADGPCRDTGKATAVVNVTFLPCPDAFVQSYDRCTCDRRLQVLGGDCIVGEPSFIVRKAGSSFWMSALYNNSDSYQGLILYKSCSMEYCTSRSVNITLDNLDVQCDLNHSGVLCGACATNYSLMLGSSKCHVCSNAYLALLVPFAAAGIALVVFLTFLRLTVATGMINGLILYANIVQVNKHLFLPADHTRLSGFLTAFIAWLNLDLGIQTCFFNGMDAYAQTWLQFAFPVYVWILIGLIVLTSRYSITVSKRIGSNPIAVLATLLLMSYTKILRIVIAVYSSVDLDYPDNKTVTVWLKDANVPYLRSKHLLLTVVTSLVLVFLFLPYTLLLLLGHKLYRYSDRKAFYWLNRIKPLLDSYYAPYKFHTRCWTGLLLLVRCVLYIEFFLGTRNRSLLAIIIIFSVAAGYLASGRIYNHVYTNIVEISLYLNLIVLSTATATDASPPALVHALLGLAFATMVGIFVYHFHISYTAKSVLWLRLRAKLKALKETTSHGTGDPDAHTQLLSATAGSSHSLSQQNSVSESFVSIREHLLEC